VVGAILREVASWPGVTEADGVLRYAGGELGRLRGDAVELSFHPRVRAMLLETGRAERAEGGRVRPADPDDAVELFRLAYVRARVAERVRDARRA
jgi:hypothetical protein